MKPIVYFKIPFKTNHFNANQKVFVLISTGALASYVVGKYRGKGRLVGAWVNWESKSKQKLMEGVIFKSIAIDSEYHKRISKKLHTF